MLLTNENYKEIALPIPNDKMKDPTKHFHYQTKEQINIMLRGVHTNNAVNETTRLLGCLLMRQTQMQ